MHARSLVHQSACMQVVLFHCAVRGQVFCDAVLIMLGVLSLCRWRTCMWQVATTFRHQSKRYTDACTTARNNLCKGNMMLLVALLFLHLRVYLVSVYALFRLPVTEVSSFVVQQQVFYAPWDMPYCPPWDMPYFPPSNPEADLSHVS